MAIIINGIEKLKGMKAITVSNRRIECVDVTSTIGKINGNLKYYQLYISIDSGTPIDVTLHTTSDARCCIKIWSHINEARSNLDRMFNSDSLKSPQSCIETIASLFK